MSSKFDQLSIDERIQLAGDLWDSVACDQAALPLTDAQRAELDRRLEAFEQDPGRRRLLEDAVREIRGRL